MMSDADQERLLDLIAEWEELRADGHNPRVEDLCPNDPELLAALRARIEKRLAIQQAIEPLPTLPFLVSGSASGSNGTADSGQFVSKEPRQIGRYRIEKLLGSGGFGRVYLAHDDKLTRYVAIKVPHTELVQRREQAEAYLHEAQSVANLDHPRIVPVFDFGSTDGFPCFIVSKYIPGTNLSVRLRESVSFPETVTILAQVAEALHYAHTQGIVHRDVKPVNILLSEHGEPFLVDFGLALREQDAGDGHRFAGTPAYMSPEQARGEAHRVDGRSDLFSLGVVFYEMLTGRRPFHGRDRAELLVEVTSVEPKPPRQINDQIPKELERICLKALSKRARDRYTTARDFADELHQWLTTAQTPASSTPNEFHSTEGVSPQPVAGNRKTPSADSTPKSSTSDGHPVPAKIVPRGLRAFDEQDADVFLRLLPGPRDRDGLPDSIRFWKTRIEQRDVNKTFTVGLIYGPSGCGKSSLVKAGLLPHLDPQVDWIYLEATPLTTESRLLRGIERRFRNLPEGLDLLAAMTALRQGRGVLPGHKVLIVVDQFEQWLHAQQPSSEQSNNELVQALRQCDGEHLQALILIRDDFWMAATDFARELEIPLVDGISTSAVNLFSVRHAKQVLIEFGRAFDCLPEAPADPTSDQLMFLDRAIDELADRGQVAPIRLVIFAEMLKERPWTPATLGQVGGIKGVGVTFLDSSFGSNAPALYRHHEQAAQRVLGALLPEPGTEIKGHVKTYAQLLEVSGYRKRPSDFEDLIRILNRELRLVTQTDPQGAVRSLDSMLDGESEQQCFQLTHDYLVPSLREWLTRRQKESRRGRAELQLQDRTSLWRARHENRSLPSLSETLSILCFARSREWSPAERQLMKQAVLWHGSRSGTLLLVVALVAFGIRQHLSNITEQKVKAAVDVVLKSTSDSAPIVMRDLKDLPKDLIQKELHARNSISDEIGKLRVAYALSEFGEVDLNYLISRIPLSSPDEADNLIVALSHARNEALKLLRLQAEQAERDARWMLKARCALAALYLGDAQDAVEMCRIEGRPDPVQRSSFIESLCSWQGRVEKLADIAGKTDDGGLRSALCLGLAGMPFHKITDRDKAAWKPLFSTWFQAAKDSATHSAAGIPLLYWGLEIPIVDSMLHPDDNRDWYINSAGLPMLMIPPRQTATSSSNSSSELNSFWISDREVMMGSIGLFLTDPANAPGDKPFPTQGFIWLLPTLPAHQTSWVDAIMFCNWLSRKEKFTPAYQLNGGEWTLVETADGYRLPTSREWEYACRAGTTSPYSFGEVEFLFRYASLNGPALDACALRFPNGWGLFDMHGNVQEWCQDTVPGPNPRLRVLRGGSFGTTEVNGSFHPDWSADLASRFERVGFRPVRAAAQPLRPRGETGKE